MVNWFGEPLYYFTGLVQYRASQLQQIVLPFSARSTVTNSGVINRGNLFPSGQELLAAYTDNPPTETIYLKGFTGGDYQGGSWAEVNESQLFQRVEQQMGDGWSSRGSGVFRFLYYNLNQWTQREDAPLPRNLTLRGNLRQGQQLVSPPITTITTIPTKPRTAIGFPTIRLPMSIWIGIPWIRNRPITPKATAGFRNITKSRRWKPILRCRKIWCPS